MRQKLIIEVDLEDIAREEDNWLCDLCALQNSICERLDVTGVTIHSINIEPAEEKK